jgi:hypothetical protein
VQTEGVGAYPVLNASRKLPIVTIALNGITIIKVIYCEQRASLAHPHASQIAQAGGIIILIHVGRKDE